MDGFGFDVGGSRRGGGHKGGHHKGGHHKHRRHHGGGGDFAPPDDGGDMDGMDGMDNGDDTDMGAEFHVGGGACHCGGTCASCQANADGNGGNIRRIGWRGHLGPDLYPSGHAHPMGADGENVGYTGHYGPDMYHSGHSHPMAGDSIVNDISDDFGCDPMMGTGSCSRGWEYDRAGNVVASWGKHPLTFGWEYDGPGNFGNERANWTRLAALARGQTPATSPLSGMTLASSHRGKKRFAGDLTAPILSNWGRYPSRSPLTGVFAGDLTPPILSNWGRYPSRSPLAGVFAGDDDNGGSDGAPMMMPMDTITASPPSPVQRINQDTNPTTSGLGGVLDVVNTVARGTASVIAAARGPRPVPPPPPPPVRHHAPVRHAPQQLRPLPYFQQAPSYVPAYDPYASAYGRARSPYNRFNYLPPNFDPYAYSPLLGY
jgi:hypothetical protein